MEMLLEKLIADFIERDLPGFTRRHVQLPRLPKKIDTIIGMRRLGKTWFLYQIISDLLARKIPRESIPYLNFEDDRLLPMTASELHQIPDVYYRRYPHLRVRFGQ
jgi:predicted AAA+ superfamily ATPase